MELITDFTPIEKLLLPNGCCFANDARNVINSWDSNDILACPGSGKTTVLIAKLKLIADKSPLKDGRGVCVLSHTNVAVSELKAKLGKSAERLLSYPNFVGTIQTFVDQYITFPFLRQFANTSIQVVSDEDYANHLYSLICKTDSKLKWFIDQQSIVHFPDYISEISSALANGSLSLSERWIRKLLSKVLHYVGIKDEAEKEYGSISIKRYISNSFPQIYQSSILSLSQIHDFSYSAVEKKVKEIFASLLGDGWLEIIPDSFMQPVREPQVASEDSHILYDESSISIVFDTVYGVKGETHDATLYLETETKKSSDIRRILPLLERKITQCKNELQEKSRRCIYVGFSRPKYLLCLAISEKTYVGHETAFSSWKIVDLRSEDAM